MMKHLTDELHPISEIEGYKGGGVYSGSIFKPFETDITKQKAYKTEIGVRGTCVGMFEIHDGHPISVDEPIDWNSLAYVLDYFGEGGIVSGSQRGSLFTDEEGYIYWCRAKEAVHRTGIYKVSDGYLIPCDNEECSEIVADLKTALNKLRTIQMKSADGYEKYSGVVDSLQMVIRELS